MDKDLVKTINDSVDFVEALNDMDKKLTKEGFDRFQVPMASGNIWGWVKNPIPNELDEAIGRANDFFGLFYFKDEDEEYATISNMLDKAGDFVKKIAGVYQFADYDNKRKLIVAFREYFDNYKVTK